MTYPIFKQLSFEAVATFCMVFAGTGAMVINDFTGGVITLPGIAITFGLVVLAMIYAVGDISGAHLKPCSDNQLCHRKKNVNSQCNTFYYQSMFWCTVRK